MIQFLGLAAGALFIFALVDIILSDGSQVRHLPKVTWVFVVIFLPLIGSILWIALGKERFGAREHISLGDPRRSQTQVEPPSEDDATAIEREIEFHENAARIRRLEAELKAKREQSPS